MNVDKKIEERLESKACVIWISFPPPSVSLKYDYVAHF